MASEISLEGVDALIERLNTMNVNVNKLVNTALQAAAVPVLEEAKNTSVFVDRSGKLRRGLKTSNVQTKDGIKYVLVGVDKGDTSQIFYGKYLEFGTSKIKARPFLEPAYEKNKSEVQSIIANTLKEGLK
jgi:HK97 gp10 family phage protein